MSAKAGILISHRGVIGSNVLWYRQCVSGVIMIGVAWRHQQAGKRNEKGDK